MFVSLTSTVVQDALTWLEKNEETPMEQLKGSDDRPLNPGSSSVPVGSGGDEYDGDEKPEIPGTAASIKCSECGKLFSDAVRAEYHATRTWVERESRQSLPTAMGPNYPAHY